MEDDASDSALTVLAVDSGYHFFGTFMIEGFKQHEVLALRKELEEAARRNRYRLMFAERQGELLVYSR